VLAAATLLLMLVGGTVTSLNAGDTEPSWSLRFWEWFQSPSRLLEKEGHVWEIGHRQIGTVVGFVMIAFLVLLHRGEERRWVRRLGWLAFAGVVAQGALGGLRVLVVSEEGDAVRSALAVDSGAGAQGLRYLFAVVHAGFAYLLFALMVCLVWLTSRRWRDGAAASAAGGREIRRLCVATAAVLYGQLLAGAYLRHALVPTAGKLALHVGGALAVALMVAWVGVRVFAARRELAALVGPAVFLLLAVQVQIALGILALVAGTGRYGGGISAALRALLETGHQIIGPLLFAGAALLVLKAYRRLAVGERLPAPSAMRAEPAVGSGQA
jgi:cytochrome c oxidase assembly protein subunit 15